MGGCCGRGDRTPPQITVFCVGTGPLLDPRCLIGVRHRALDLCCGADRVLVDAWVATLDTPLFTVAGYETECTLGTLARDDVVMARKFNAFFTSIVSLDGSKEVQHFAKELGVPLFQGPAGLFWALRDAAAK